MMKRGSVLSNRHAPGHSVLGHSVLGHSVLGDRSSCAVITVTDLGKQAPMRDFVRVQLTRAGFGADMVLDTQLVLTELVTNAIEHGRATAVCIELYLDGPQVSVALTYRSLDGVGPPATTPMPGEFSRRGRGLAIVDNLTTSFAVVNDPGGDMRVECVIAPQPSDKHLNGL